MSSPDPYSLILWGTMGPLLLIWLAMAGYKMTYTLCQWHGNPERTLLLRLLEEIEEEAQ